jgi:hypothetical protein
MTSRAVPNQLLFTGWKSRLQSIELYAIEMEFTRLVNGVKGAELVTARLLPFEICALGRHDWDGTPFMHIWEKACDRDRARTCWCFAVFLWDHMLRRSDTWEVTPMDLDAAPLAATKYVRRAVPNVMKQQREMTESLVGNLLA